MELEDAHDVQIHLTRSQEKQAHVDHLYKLALSLGADIISSVHWPVSILWQQHLYLILLTLIFFFERQRGPKKSCPHWFISPMPARVGLCQPRARNPELSMGFLCGWQELKYLRTLLCTIRNLELETELRVSNLEVPRST